jgi:hypothetical protein
METEISTIPYEPHRYVDELPATARSSFAVWTDSVARGDEDAVALALKLDVVVMKPDPDRPAVKVVRREGTLFEDVAVGISALQTYTAQEAAALVIFGSLTVGEVRDLIEAVMESDEARNLRARVLYRVDHGTFNATDVAWIKRQAAENVTDDDFPGMSPFDGDHGEAKEIARRVVRGRRDHHCHQTGLIIPAGEPHLMIKEVMEGEFLTTRHGIVAAWFSAFTESPELAEMLKPDEPPLAAAA